MTRRRKMRTVKSEMNVIPFLDVLLVLLLIFMATAPFISQSVEVNLPDAVDSKTIDTKETPTVILEVSLSEGYTLTIDGERNENLSPENVVTLAQQAFSKNNETLFLVGGDKAVVYDEIIKALSLLHASGITSVGLMTNPG